MSITRKDVEETALLARLALSEPEIERMVRQLGSILEHIRKLQELDTSAVEPTTHVVPMDCPLRPDQTEPPLASERALAAAPRRDGELFEVPRIVTYDPGEPS
jgi:aspartyl-tRNA(Asn)/glutamyl-tRNA(Gln) amidotransferase subunit C